MKAQPATTLPREILGAICVNATPTIGRMTNPAMAPDTMAPNDAIPGEP
jgi:hypothetical protein